MSVSYTVKPSINLEVACSEDEYSANVLAQKLYFECLNIHKYDNAPEAQRHHPTPAVWAPLQERTASQSRTMLQS